MEEELPSVSVIVPTRERPEVLNDLLTSLATQSLVPTQIIIIDDSPSGSAKWVTDRYIPRLNAVSCSLIYLMGTAQGNTIARNIGIAASTGDAVLFLDDDVLLEPDTIRLMTAYLRKNPNAMGVQPVIIGSGDYWESNKVGVRLENTAYKALMLSYHDRDRQGVRRSGAPIYPSTVTHIIPVQKFSGCCMIRREALGKEPFDTNLRRWGLYDDLDFSYRIYTRYPGSLFCLPEAKIIHKASPRARLPQKEVGYMAIIYWTYIFFKDFYAESPLNLLAFAWALWGYLAVSSFDLIFARNPRKSCAYVYMLGAYIQTIRNLRSIRSGNLEFFNRRLIT